VDAIRDDLFVQIAAVLLVSALLGAVAARLRQPLVLAFLAVGVLVGPEALGVIEPGGTLGVLAELGIALLLFTVGLKLDLHVIRALGPVAVLAGVVQVAVTAALGFLLAAALGVSGAGAFYVGIGLAFSSTVVIVKLLSDKREINELHGRLAVGILIVQDLLVVVVLIVLGAFGGEEDGNLVRELLLVAVQGAALLGGLALLARFVLTPVMHQVARVPELLVLFSIAFAVSLAALGDLLDVGTAVGAFLGGVALATTPYRETIAGRLVALRDFLLLFFFIELGLGIELDAAAGELPRAFALAAFALLVKPLLVILILGPLGYRRRVSFEAGITLGQISEFSLILAATAVSLGQIEDETLALITVVAVITFAASSYLIPNAEWLYLRLEPWLGIFERTPGRFAQRFEEEPGQPRPEVIVLGLGRYGGVVAERLHRAGVPLLGVDYDPLALGDAEQLGIPVLYGDVEDPELPHGLPLDGIRWIVSSVRRADANLALVHALGHHAFQGKLAVAADTDRDRARLLAAGVDQVLVPYTEAADHVVRLVAEPGPPVDP
jgi:Kef-type K+ transport system membrane component KefB